MGTERSQFGEGVSYTSRCRGKVSGGVLLVRVWCGSMWIGCAHRLGNAKGGGFSLGKLSGGRVSGRGRRVD